MEEKADRMQSRLKKSRSGGNATFMFQGVSQRRDMLNTKLVLYVEHQACALKHFTFNSKRMKCMELAKVPPDIIAEVLATPVPATYSPAKIVKQRLQLCNVDNVVLCYSILHSFS